MAKQLDHLDEQLHGIRQDLAGITAFIDEHRPALARGLSLIDPAAKLRSAFGKKKI